MMSNQPGDEYATKSTVSSVIEHSRVVVVAIEVFHGCFKLLYLLEWSCSRVDPVKQLDFDEHDYNAAPRRNTPTYLGFRV